MELNIDLLLDVVNRVHELDRQLSEAKGTAAERKQKAAAAVGETPRGKQIQQTVTSLREQLAELQQEWDDMVTDHIKTHAGTSDKIDGLKAQRAAAVEQANAIKTLLESIGTDTSAIAMPSKAGPRVGNGSSGGGVKTSGSRHYIVQVDGSHKYYSNTSFSYLAFALKMTQGNGGAEALDRAIRDAGVTERTKPWECTITIPEGPRQGETVTVGMVVDENSNNN